MTQRISRVLSLLPFLLAACGGDSDLVRVDVRTDWVPTVEFAEVEIGLDEAGSTSIYDASASDDFLTGIRVATLEGVSHGNHTVRARLLAADGRRLASRLVSVNVDGPKTVTLIFTRDCAAVECPGDGDAADATECLGGQCVTPECSPENPDACGTAQCTTDDDCPAPSVGCARAICNAGTCFVGAASGTCATSEYCNPETGCTPRPTGDADMGSDGMRDMGGMDAGAPMDASFDMGPPDLGLPEECGQPCDTGDLCEVGIYECSTGAAICVRDTLVAAGTTCRDAVDTCDVAEVCDGESPACPIDAFAATGATCAAGFCDGLGTCSDTCTPGASCSTGNPCETGTISCDTGAPVCERSGNAADGISCAATENGAWSACGDYSGTCDTTGTRTRTVTTYACQAGACTPSAAPDSESCGRSTEGVSCGSVSTGSWGACGGYSGTCGESGTRSRSVTTPTCQSGSCANVVTSESGSCSRDTDGDSCGSVSQGSWGSCGGYSGTCDETGTRSRSITTPTCASGSCANVVTSENGSCTRDTDGDSCGSVSYGSWGSCGGYSNTCDETGTRSRSVTTPTCGSGSCSNVSSSQNGSCTRDTDGTSCGSVTYGAWGACSYSSTCDETGTRSRDVYTPVCASASCASNTTTQTESCTRNTDGTSCGGGFLVCNTRLCSSGSCQTFDTCGAGQHCCEFGCQPNGTLCP